MECIFRALQGIAGPPGSTLHLNQGSAVRTPNTLIKYTERMLGTFNQHLPMILSHNYWCQRKPTSLVDTGMDGVPYFCAAEHEICPIY